MQIDKVVFVFCFVSLLVSCNTLKSPFGKRSPHEKYADAITNAGLKETVLGKAWFDAAQNAWAYRKISLKESEKLMTNPSSGSPVRDSIIAGEKVNVLGVFKDYFFVNYKGIKGWIIKSS